MGNLTLNGATSGQITLAPTAVAGTNTLTLPAATGTVALTSSPTFSGTVTATTVTSPAATALTLQSAGTTAITVDTSQNATFAGTVNMSSSFLRNRIINGNMQVWQRGTSATGTYSSPTYATADRWVYYSAASMTTSQSTSVPTGFQYSLKVQRPAAATTTNNIYAFQVIESVNMADLAGQSVTLSFWAKAGANFSASGNTLYVNVNTGTVADQGSSTGLGGWTGVATPINTSATLTTTWTKYTYTGTIASNALEMDAVFYFTPTGTAGADDAVYITGVQLEQGSVATPFERPLYSKQLADCQRYFEMSYDQGTAIGSATSTGSSWAFSFGPAGFTSGGIQTYYKVSKRAAPTVTTYSIVTGASGKVYSSANAADYTTTINGSGLFGFGAYWTQASANSINASYHWTSSAEL